MADIYVRSTDGNDADNGSTWALAKATLAGAAAIDAAGDRIFVSDNHAESSGSAQDIALAGTPASPTKVICGDDAAEPPTAVATTGSVTTTSGAINIDGSAYIYGLTFIGAGGVIVNDAAAATEIQFRDCSLQITGNVMTFGHANVANVPTRTIFRNCTFKFPDTAARHSLSGEIIYEGGSIVSGSSTPNPWTNAPADRTYCDFKINGFDFTNFASTLNLIGVGGFGNLRAVFRNCKMPASWSGSPISGTILVSQRVEMYNCDSGDTNYRLWIEDYAGSIKHDTGIYLAASDGTTTISWKMVSSANAEYPLPYLESPEIVRWNETTAAAITVTVEIARDGTSTNLKDDEIWIDVQYLGTSGFPLGSFTSDEKASVLATAADQTSSSASWTGLGGTNAKQKLAVTFTPNEKGFIHARVRLAKASTTVYVDPVLTVS